MNPVHDLLRRLGADPDAPTIDQGPPTDATGHGYAATAMKQAASNPVMQPAVRGLEHAVRWAHRDRFTVAAGAVERLLAGAVEDTADAAMLQVDTRAEPALLGLVDGRLLLLEPGRVRVFAAPKPATTQIDAPPPSEPALTPPDVTSWGLDLEPWLDALARDQAASPVLHERAATVGLVARLYAGPGTVGSEAFAQARAWVETVPADVWLDVEREALDSCELLFDRLLAAPDLEAATAWVTSLFQLRDLLASAQLTLGLAGHGAALTEALAECDHVAVTRIGELTELAGALDPAFDDHRGAISWQEPEAWWHLLP